MSFPADGFAIIPTVDNRSALYRDFKNYNNYEYGVSHCYSIMYIIFILTRNVLQ